jgi:hypothetical protein
VEQPLEWDRGEDAQKLRRVVELAGWLQAKPDGAPFTRPDVLALSSWARYADQAEHTFNTAFRSATDLLAGFGIDVEWIGDAYRTRRRIRLTPEERQALLVALSVADPGEPWGDDDALPFGLGIDRRAAEAVLDCAAELDVVVAAIHERRAVEIGHRGTRRRVDPYGIGFRGGRWYLIGRDHRRDRTRVFGLGRSGPDPAPAVAVGEPGAVVPPEDLDVTAVLETALDPTRWADWSPVRAVLRVDGAALDLADRFLGRDAGTPDPPRPDPDGGSVVVEARTRTVEHLDVEGLVHAMAALRTHAVLLEPPEAVAALRAHLQAIVDLDVDAAPDLGPSADPPRPTPATAAGITTATPPSRVGGGRLTAARRWRVITTALALGEGRDGAVTIEEIARLTDTTSAQARAALEQYAGCSVVHDGEDDFVHPGLTITGPGTGPDGGTVSVTAPWLLGQWQPTPAQALRLLVAATAALALSAATRPTDPGRADPDARLRTAQQKLARYLAVTLGHRDGGAGELHRLVAVAAPSAPPIVREIAAVIARGRTVVVVTGDGMGTLGERTTELDPVQVRFVTDRWVLEGRVRWRDPAPDHGDDGSPAPAGSAEIVRMPIDVIRRVEEGPDDADPDPPDAPAEPVDAPVVVTLDLDPGALWMLDPYPVHALDRTGDGRVRITATIPDAVELRTLLLCIGARGRLREPAALRRRPAEIARAMLDRHSA